MKTFNQFITEAFNSTYNWKWTNQISERRKQATFFTDSKREIKVKFVSEDLTFDEVTWSVSFIATTETGTTTYKSTGDYDALKILSTVLEIMRNFIDSETYKKNPAPISFTVDKSGIIDRESIYTKMLHKFLPPNATFKKVAHINGFTDFIIYPEGNQ